MNKSKFQVFIEQFVLTSLSLLKIVLLSKIFIKKIKPSDKQKNNCIILGNGPSFKKSIETSGLSSQNADIVCVNYFPLSDYYSSIQPRYFVTAAPEFWLENVSEEFIVGRQKILTAIFEKTTWDLVVYIPVAARKNKVWQESFKKNKHIKIVYFNATPIDGFKWFKHFCFKANLGMPRPHNVLIPSLILMINKKYKNIYLLGADHSWLNEITVDENNDVLVCQKHFYDEYSAKGETMKKLGLGKRKLHEVLHKFYISFGNYFIINDFAKTLDVNIYNSTPNSFIDAFERKPIEDSGLEV